MYKVLHIPTGEYLHVSSSFGPNTLLLGPTNFPSVITLPLIGSKSIIKRILNDVIVHRKIVIIEITKRNAGTYDVGPYECSINEFELIKIKDK